MPMASVHMSQKICGMRGWLNHTPFYVRVLFYMTDWDGVTGVREGTGGM